MSTQELFARIHDIPGDAWLDILKATCPDFEVTLDTLEEYEVVADSDSVYILADGWYLKLFTSGNLYFSWYQTTALANIPNLLTALEAALESTTPTPKEK